MALKFQAMEGFLERLHEWRLNRAGIGELVPIHRAPEDELEHWFDILMQTLEALGIWIPTPGLKQ